MAFNAPAPRRTMTFGWEIEGVLSDLDLAWNQLDGDEAAKCLAQLLRSSAPRAFVLRLLQP